MINIIGKDLFPDGKLVKINVLKIFIAVMFVLLALLALLMSPEIGRNSCLRQAIAHYFELNYFKHLL